MSEYAQIEQSSKSAADLLSEVAEILVAGLLRLEARKSSEKTTGFGESSLHFSPDQSGGRPIPENGEPQ